MKTISVYFFITLLFIASACNNATRNSGNPSSENKPDKPVSGQVTSMDELYDLMTTIPLPFVFNHEFISKDRKLTYIPNTVSHLFYNSENFNPGAEIAKFPQQGNLRPVLVLYKAGGEEMVMDLYTLSNDMNILDRLQIYSIEKTGNGSHIISQLYHISDDFIVNVYKKLDNVLIEQLYFTPDENGKFVEMRDGKTPVVAYESPDNKHYMVESFIWDHQANGGIYKKDVKKTYYLLTVEGLKEIKESEYNSAYRNLN